MDKYLALMAAGTIIRILLAPFFGHSWDMYVWIESGGLAARGVNVYEIRELTDFPWGFYAYPPLWLYWLTAVSALATDITALEIKVALIKAPIILTDILSAILLYRLARLYSLENSKARKITLLFYLNPISILISSVWGMFDSIAVLLTLAASYLLLKRRIIYSGLALALGTAAKIYPSLLLIPFSIYLAAEKEKRWRELAYLISSFALGILIAALPYMRSIPAMLDKLLFHFTNIGQFTYWVALSNFSNTSLISLLSITSFILLCLVIVNRCLQYRSESLMLLLYAVNGILLAFLATSSKVNVQYITWVLPFLLLLLTIKPHREMMFNLVAVIILGISFIVSGQFSLALFDLKNLGRITPQTGTPLSSISSVIIVASGIAAGTRFISLLFNILQIRKTSFWNTTRVTVIGLVVIMAVSLSIFPSPKGVTLPYAPLRVGVLSGVEAFFHQEGDMGVPLFKQQFDLTHLAITVSPEIVSNPVHTDFSKNSRFKLTTTEWNEEMMRRLVSRLHENGVKVLLGLYLKSYAYEIHFGYHGYNATWLTQNHPYLTDKEGNIYFQFVLKETNKTYADFFAGNALEIAERMGFDGFYIMGVDWGRGVEIRESIRALLSSLKERNVRYPVFLEIDALTSNNGYSEYFNLADYLVVRTDPWVRRVKENLIGNYTIESFRTALDNVARNALNTSSKVLFTVHTIEVVEGWITPAVELQREVDEFSSVAGVEGYSIYTVSRYIPYMLRVEKPLSPYSP